MKIEQEMWLKTTLHCQTAVDNSILTTSLYRKICGSDKCIVLVSINIL